MNDDYIPPKAPMPRNSSDADEQETTVDRVFDISDEGIKPIAGDWNSQPAPRTDPPAQTPVPPKPSPATAAPASPPVPSARPYISPDTDLLDKNIGTFDASPFASANMDPKPPAPQTANKPRPPIPKETIPAYNSNLPPLQKSPTQRPPVQKITEIRPEAPPAPRPTPVITPQSIPGQPTLVPRKPAPIPIQDISSSLDKAQTQGTAPKSLQEEILASLRINPQKQAPTPMAGQPIDKAPDGIDPGMQKAESAKPVRTYEADVAAAMAHQQTSRASIAIAESKRREGEERISSTDTEPSSHAGKKLFMILLSLVLLGGGAFGAYYLYSISPLAPSSLPAPQTETVPSVVPADLQAIVTIDPSNPLMIRSRIQSEISKTQKPGTIKNIVIATRDAAGGLARIKARDMIGIMDVSAPDILTRSLVDDWMLGVYADATGEKSVFVVVGTDFFQNAFAGMLQWESVMADDLRLYLYPLPPQGISNSSDPRPRDPLDPLANLESILPSTASTSATSSKPSIENKVGASSTAPIASSTADSAQMLRSYIALRGRFEDRIIRNKDVRAFRTDDGSISFLYSFIDNSHIVITNKESTLEEMIFRIGQQSFIR